MFGKDELERLRLQKELLVLQSNANRLLLAGDFQRLRAPETWMTEAGSLVKRHPVWSALLTAATGALVVQLFRKPGNILGGLGGLGGLGKLAATALSVWKLMRRGNSAE
jgi:hypothetical protein